MKKELKQLETALNELSKSGDVSKAAFSTLNFALQQVKNCIIPSVMWRVLYHIPLIGMVLPNTSWFLQNNRWFITYHLSSSLIVYVGGLILWLTQHAT